MNDSLDPWPDRPGCAASGAIHRRVGEVTERVRLGVDAQPESIGSDQGRDGPAQAGDTVAITNDPDRLMPAAAEEAP